MNLSEIHDKNQTPYIPECYRELMSQKERKVYLYGNGKYAEMVWEDLERYFCANIIDGVFVSAEYQGDHKHFKGNKIEIWNEKQLKEDIELIIGFEPIRNENKILELMQAYYVKKIYIFDSMGFLWQKKWQGMDCKKIYYMDRYYKIAMPRELDYAYASGHKQELRRTYDLLEDELSRRTMKVYIEGHLYQKNYPMKQVWSPRAVADQYFPDFFQWKDNEVVVDCGAFNGDTFESYIDHVGTFEKYYAIEPDEEQHQKLLEKISYYENTVLIKMGCSDIAQTIYLEKQQGCGVVTHNKGEKKINVVALDDILSESDVTFIKMDIEGSELQALKGAVKLIQKNKPKLAICVYHKREDLIEIPEFIKNICSEYKIYLRAHWPNLSELVLYAV